MTHRQLRLDRQSLDWTSPLPATLMARPVLQLDLSDANRSLQDVAVDDAAAFGRWIDMQARDAGCDWALGGYAEDRAIYAMSPVFSDGANTRSVHLGIDFWLPAGTEVYAVADGTVHSTGDNARFGDYGPTIILTHTVGDATLHTLYGHLARPSLDLTQPGRLVEAGQRIGWLGEPAENVGWPPHLHFQVIADISDHRGDFPGVCLATEADAWLQRCPDPMELVRAWCPRLLSLRQPGKG